MAVPIARACLSDLYFLIDLYFVAGLGDAAIAGVGAAGNIMFIVFSLTQVLGVGTVALNFARRGAQGSGRRDIDFQPDLVLSSSCALITLVLGYGVRPCLRTEHWARTPPPPCGDELLALVPAQPGAAVRAGRDGLGAARHRHRAAHDDRAGATVILNAVLAPVLIAGWGTGPRMGVAGAGLRAPCRSGSGWCCSPLFPPLGEVRGIRCRRMAPQLCSLGSDSAGSAFPPAENFALMFIFFMAVIYWILRRFRSGCPAGYGIGQRNHAKHVSAGNGGGGCNRAHRPDKTTAQESSRCARDVALPTLIGGLHPWVILTLFCQWGSDGHPRVYQDPTALARRQSVSDGGLLELPASDSYSLVSAVFQGLGHTLPAVLSSASRLVSFARRRSGSPRGLNFSWCSSGTCRSRRHAASLLESLAGARRISAAACRSSRPPAQ